jgi:Uma2 family endonuclease
VKLRASADRIYYPDVMIVCGRAAEVDCVVECPSIVVEVTSPGTRATDRREKLEAYRCIASLRLYLIVEQRYRQVLAYSRAPDGQWVREEFSIGQDVPIRALDTTVAVDAIYDDVPMPPLRLGEKEIEWWEEPAATP